jgi:hypothetical protein
MAYFSNSRESIDRAEKIAHRLELQRIDRLAERKQVEEFEAAIREGRSWRKPGSLSVPRFSSSFGDGRARVKRYEFTDAQMQIALRSLDAGGAV